MMSSHDFEDIINIVEGRSALVDDIRNTVPPLRAFVVGRLAEILADQRFRNTLPGLITPDELHAQRVAAVLARLSEVSAL